MTALSIVVEGRTDAVLLKKVLPKEDVARLRFFAAQGQISLSTVGRNIVVHEGSPVLVVMDADTPDRETADEARQYTKARMRQVAGNVPVDVFAFIPEIEVVFFEAPEFWAGLRGRELEQAELSQGLAAPKKTAMALAKQAGLSPSIEAIIKHIDKDGADALRRGEQLAALIAVLHHLMEGASAAERLTGRST